MDAWQSILFAFGGNAALLIVLGVLARSALKHWLTKDVDGFKVKIQSRADIELERLRHDLQSAGAREVEHLRSALGRSAVEHQVRFSKLHDQRANVIAEIDRMLAETHWAAAEFASPFSWANDPSKTELLTRAQNKLVELYRYIDSHRVWLPASIAAQLESFITESRTIIWGFGVYVMNPHADVNPDTAVSKSEAWFKASAYFDKDVPNVRRALEREMRRILGDSSDETPSAEAAEGAKSKE